MAGNILATMLLMIQSKSDTSGLNRTDNAIRRTTRTVRNARKEMSLLGVVSRNMSRLFLGGVGIWGAINAGNSFLQLQKDLGAMQSRFFAITKDEKRAGEEFDWVRKKATDLALDIKSTADSYSIFYSSVEKSMGDKGARQVYDNWMKVGRVLHLSEYQMERVTYAIREMASKGAIYSQDLRMQIGTHVPNAMGLAQKAAEEMGITGSNWFDVLQKKAKGNSQLTADFIRRFSAQAEKQFASPEALSKSLSQTDALVKKVSNIGTNFMIDFSNAGGTDMVIKILQGISDALTSIDYKKIAEHLGSIAKVVGDVFQYLPQIFTIIKEILVAVLAIGVSRLFSRMAIGIARISLQWKILARMFAKTNPLILFAVIRHALGNTIAKIFTGVGLATLTKLGIRFIPIIGQIITAVWLIADVIKIIRNLMPGGDKNKTDMFNKYGTNATQLVSIIDAVHKHPEAFKNPETLSRQISFYKGGQEASRHVYVDNGKITFEFNGSFITEDEIRKIAKQGAEQVKENRTNAITKFFNKPKQYSNDDIRSLYE